jgi:ribosomal protein S18 acetylase RimI-like enzyme
MTEFRISREDDAPPEDRTAVVDGLVAFNNRQVGDENFQRLVLILRDEEGAVRGGLLGGTLWDWLYVSHLWVDDEARGCGLGRRLMLEAEEAARARGCRHVHLDTFSFQARPFYESLGYEVFGELRDYPPGHSRYFLVKHLDAPAS